MVNTLPVRDPPWSTFREAATLSSSGRTRIDRVCPPLTSNELFDQWLTAGVVEPGPYPDRGLVLPWVDPRAHHVFHQYVIRVTRRDELRAWLAERGIGSEVYYPLALHQQKALASLGYREGAFPESERAAREVLALPIFPQLRDDEQERVVGAIRGFLN